MPEIIFHRAKPIQWSPIMFAVVLLALLISVPVRAELRDPNNSADYIILTNQEVLSNNAWIDNLLDYRAAQGRVSMAVTVEEIWAEFTPSGSDSAIREFLHYAYENWQAPQLKDVFIVGHWDVVPTHLMESIVDSFSYWSDYWYAEASDSEFWGPRIRIGRLPWSPRYTDSLESFFDKISIYESSSGGEWLNRCHLIADSSDGLNPTPEDWVQYIARQVPASVLIERDYLGRPIGDPWHGTREEILEHLSSGNLFTTSGKFGSSYNFLSADTSDASDIYNLQNINSLTTLFSPCSYALGIDSIDGTPIMFAALNSSSGGAIAAFGFSGVPWYMGTGNYGRRLAPEMFSSNNLSIGDAWNACCHYLVDSVMQHHGGTSVSETLFGTFLLGDPATIIPGRTTSADPIVAPAIPASIQIVGNYPNPFNPSTTINFMLNRAGSARLTVYDITGRAVTTLAEQSFTAGQHSIVWNAQGLASGIYLVRLESAGQFDTHKITLLK